MRNKKWFFINKNAQSDRLTQSDSGDQWVEIQKHVQVFSHGYTSDDETRFVMVNVI